MRKILITIAMLLMSLFTFAETAALKVGDYFPNITFEKMNGEKVEFSSLKGKDVLLNFTASWCPYCKVEKERMGPEYEETLKNIKDLEVIVLFGDYGKETRESVETYMMENKFTFPSYYDTGKKIAAQVGVKGVPLNYYINKEGRIQEITTYYYDLKSLEGKIKK